MTVRTQGDTRGGDLHGSAIYDEGVTTIYKCGCEQVQ